MPSIFDLLGLSGFGDYAPNDPGPINGGIPRGGLLAPAMQGYGGLLSPTFQTQPQLPEGRSVTRQPGAMPNADDDGGYGFQPAQGGAPMQLSSTPGQQSGQSGVTPPPGTVFDGAGALRIAPSPAATPSAGDTGFNAKIGAFGDMATSLGVGLLSKRGFGPGLAAGMENYQRQHLVNQQTDALKAKTALTQQQLVQKGVGQNATYDYLISKGKDADQSRAAVLAAAGGNDKPLTDMLKDNDKVGTFTGSDGKFYTFDKTDPSTGASAIPGQASGGFRLADGRPATEARPGDVIYDPQGKPSILSPNGTNIGIDQRGESAEAAEAGKKAGERRSAMLAAADTAPEKIARVNLLRNVLSNTQTGPLAGVKGQAGAVAMSLGIAPDTLSRLGIDPAQPTNNEVAQKLSNELVMGSIGPGGFPANNFSNADRSFLEKTFPSIMNQPGSNEVVSDVLVARHNRELQKADAYADYRAAQRKAGKATSYEDFEDDWRANHGQENIFAPIQQRYLSGGYGVTPVTPSNAVSKTGANAQTGGGRRTKSGISYSMD